MTRDDIIRMAREAGIHHAHDSEGHWDGLTDHEVVDRLPRFRQELEYADKRIVEILERFAALVAVHAAAKEREWMQDINKRLIAEAVAAERERICEMLMDLHKKEERHNYYGFIAKMIKESA
jgi:hypothetical protein